MLHQQVDTVRVSGCHVVVRSILADQWIGPEVFVMICGVLQKDASVHRGYFRFDWTGKAMPFVATAVPPQNGSDDSSIRR